MTELFIAFGAGLLSFLSPCVLPLIPGYISYISGTTYDELLERKVKVYPLIFFTIGFSIVFILFGAAATFIGQLFLSYSNELRIIAGIVILIFSFHILGFLNVKIFNYEKKFQVSNNNSFFGPIVLGMAFGFGWTPCIGPILGSILVLISLLWSGYRLLKIENTMNEVMLETAKTTSLVFIILLGAAILTSAFRAFGGEELVREFLNSLPGGFWSKFLIFYFKNQKLMLVHLGMTGKFFFIKKDNNYKTSFYYNLDYQKDRKHDRVTFFFNNKRKLIYNDIRKFGFIKFYKPDEVLNSQHLVKIGPEPFSKEYDFDYFKLNSKKTTNIKNLLMNQNFVAGLGNIYCSEILFDAKISPKKRSKNLNNKQIKQIIKSTKKILYKAVSFGGTTIKNFVVSNEKIGYFKNELKVYGKEDTGCVRCSKINKIKRIVQSGRSTFFCENCQK